MTPILVRLTLSDFGVPGLLRFLLHRDVLKVVERAPGLEFSSVAVLRGLLLRWGYVNYRSSDPRVPLAEMMMVMAR